MKIARLLKPIPWWLWLAGINLFLVVASAYQHTFSLPLLGERILRQFDLGEEMNLAAWWSAMLLFSIGLFCYEIYCDREARIAPNRANRSIKVAWLLLAIAFTCLSIDEIGSVHERIETWIQIIDRYVPLALSQLVDPYVPIIIAGLILIPFPLITLWGSRETKRSAIFLLVGFLLLSTIAFQERLEGAIEWARWGGIRMGVEEGTELLGKFFCYWGVVLQRSSTSQTKGLRRAIPNPLLMNNIEKLVLIGIIVHLCLTIFVSVTINVDYSGRTLVWYPAAISFLIGLTAYWQYSLVKYPKSRILLIASIYFLLASAIAPYLIYPSISPQLPALIESYFYYLYGLQLLLIIIIYKLIYQTISPEAFILIPLLVISLLLGANIPGEIARYTIVGIFSYLVARLILFKFLKQEAPNQQFK